MTRLVYHARTRGVVLTVLGEFSVAVAVGAPILVPEDKILAFVLMSLPAGIAGLIALGNGYSAWKTRIELRGERVDGFGSCMAGLRAAARPEIQRPLAGNSQCPASDGSVLRPGHFGVARYALSRGSLCCGDAAGHDGLGRENSAQAEGNHAEYRRRSAP
jgi:hypothetical protein